MELFAIFQKRDGAEKRGVAGRESTPRQPSAPALGALPSGLRARGGTPLRGSPAPSPRAPRARLALASSPLLLLLLLLLCEYRPAASRPRSPPSPPSPLCARPASASAPRPPLRLPRLCGSCAPPRGVHGRSVPARAGRRAAAARRGPGVYGLDPAPRRSTRSASGAPRAHAPAAVLTGGPAARGGRLRDLPTAWPQPPAGGAGPAGVARCAALRPVAAHVELATVLRCRPYRSQYMAAMRRRGLSLPVARHSRPDARAHGAALAACDGCGGARRTGRSCLASLIYT